MANLQYLARNEILTEQNMRLMYASTSRYDTDWLSVPHSHSCTELFYCVRGVGKFIIGNQEYPVGSDDLIVINANVEHTEISYPSNPLEYIVLGIDGANFSFLSQDTPWHATNFSQSEEDVLPQFSALLQELHHRSSQYELVCRHLLEIIFIKIHRQLQFCLSTVEPEAVNKECAQVKRYIDTHFQEALTLDHLASLVHINKYYLSHSFQSSYGISPMNYMMELRIAASKHMLSKTNYSISHISQANGFSSPSYFAQSFKKYVKITPNQFRNQTK